MKKITITLTIIFLLSLPCFATLQRYIGRQIFVETIDGAYFYQGQCISISDAIITIRYISTDVKILTIPMHQIKKFYRMEEIDRGFDK